MNRMRTSPLPWEQDCVGGNSMGGEDAYEALYDANGKIIADTANSDVAEIREEEGHYWDEQGRRDFAFIRRAVANFENLLVACKEARAALEMTGICSCGPNRFVCTRCKGLEYLNPAISKAEAKE